MSTHHICDYNDCDERAAAHVEIAMYPDSADVLGITFALVSSNGFDVCLKHYSALCTAVPNQSTHADAR